MTRNPKLVNSPWYYPSLVGNIHASVGGNNQFSDTVLFSDVHSGSSCTMVPAFVNSTYAHMPLVNLQQNNAIPTLSYCRHNGNQLDPQMALTYVQAFPHTLVGPPRHLQHSNDFWRACYPTHYLRSHSHPFFRKASSTLQLRAPQPPVGDNQLTKPNLNNYTDCCRSYSLSETENRKESQASRSSSTCSNLCLSPLPSSRIENAPLNLNSWKDSRTSLVSTCTSSHKDAREEQSVLQWDDENYSIQPVDESVTSGNMELETDEPSQHNLMEDILTNVNHNQPDSFDAGKAIPSEVAISASSPSVLLSTLSQKPHLKHHIDGYTKSPLTDEEPVDSANEISEVKSPNQLSTTIDAYCTASNLANHQTMMNLNSMNNNVEAPLSDLRHHHQPNGLRYNTVTNPLQSAGTSTSCRCPTGGAYFIPSSSPLTSSLSSSYYLENLSMTIWQFYTNTKQTPIKYSNKVHLRNALHVVVSGVFKNAGLHIVGSSMNGFGSDQSDMDMCLTVTSRELQQKEEAFVVLSQLLAPLRKCSFIRNSHLIRAKVPILKFRDTLAQVDCDLNVNNVVGIYNTHLLAMYTRIDWRVRPLGMFVKYWAQRMDIHDGSRGRLSTYPLLLMLIQYLQASCCPPILPNLQARFPKLFSFTRPLTELDMRLELPWSELRSTNTASLADLFVGFIHYYGNEFDFNQWAVSVRHGAPLPIDVAIRRLPPHEQAHTARSFKVFVEEPFCQTNAARSLYDDSVLVRIRQAFVKTSQAFRSQRPLESIWLNNNPNESM